MADMTICDHGCSSIDGCQGNCERRAPTTSRKELLSLLVGMTHHEGAIKELEPRWAPVVQAELDRQWHGRPLDPVDIWFVGTALPDGRWMVEGAFETEAEAAESAKEDEFILLGELGARLPVLAKDAKKVYWPKKETWEQSALYKMRSAFLMERFNEQGNGPRQAQLAEGPR